MELTTPNSRVPNSGSWKPGQSGNLAGKPVGARHRFSRAFLENLAEIWSAEGRNAMLVTAKTSPSTFFAVASRLIPADVKLTVEQTFGGLSPEDLALLQAAKECIPDANNKTPAEVLAYCRDALRAHAAKPIHNLARELGSRWVAS
jgi:hypothetical protein